MLSSGKPVDPSLRLRDDPIPTDNDKWRQKKIAQFIRKCIIDNEDIDDSSSDDD